MAASIVTEERDRSRNEDAKHYTAATSLAFANTSIGLGPRSSSRRRHDLFADLLPAGTRGSLSQDQTATPLASDDDNIFAVARYLRKVADAGSVISLATLPRRPAAYPGIAMDAHSGPSAAWPRPNIEALGSEYTSNAWGERDVHFCGSFVLAACDDIEVSGAL